jgi:hypothetical protein
LFAGALVATGAWECAGAALWWGGRGQKYRFPR